MKQALLVPTDGKFVPHPGTRRGLALEGEVVPLDRYWRRRLDEGVVRVQDPGASTSSPAPVSSTPVEPGPPITLTPEPVRMRPGGRSPSRSQES